MSKCYRIYYIFKLKYRDRDRYLQEKIDDVEYLESCSREDVISRMNKHLHEQAEAASQRIRKDNDNECDLRWLSYDLPGRLEYCEYTDIEVIDGIFEYDDEEDSSGEIENYKEILAQKLRSKINASLAELDERKRLVKVKADEERRRLYEQLKQEFEDEGENGE